MLSLTGAPPLMRRLEKKIMGLIRDFFGRESKKKLGENQPLANALRYLTD